MSFTVFLGNLPTWVTADDIKQWLAAEDLVADAVKVIRNHETQESKGFAFVEAPTNDEMQAIIRRFDRAPLEDRLLRANPAQPPKGKEVPRGPQPAASAVPMLLHACSLVRIANAAAVRSANSRLAALLLPSWPKYFRPTRVRPGGGRIIILQFHTCERQAHRSRLLFLFPTKICNWRPACARRPHEMCLARLSTPGRPLFAAPQDFDTNVNARYTVETVILSGKGWTTNLRSETTNKISTGLLHQLTAIIGQKLNPAYLDTLAQNLKKELSAREVTHRIVRGETPEQVRVEFEVRPARASLGMNVNQFLYDSEVGFSGSGEAAVTTGPHVFALGLVSNGDWLPERFSGIVARYEDSRIGTDRLSFQIRSRNLSYPVEPGEYRSNGRESGGCAGALSGTPGVSAHRHGGTRQAAHPHLGSPRRALPGRRPPGPN